MTRVVISPAERRPEAAVAEALHRRDAVLERAHFSQKERALVLGARLAEPRDGNASLEFGFAFPRRGEVAAQRGDEVVHVPVAASRLGAFRARRERVVRRVLHENERTADVRAAETRRETIQTVQTVRVLPVARLRRARRDPPPREIRPRNLAASAARRRGVRRQPRFRRRDVARTRSRDRPASQRRDWRGRRGCRRPSRSVRVRCLKGLRKHRSRVRAANVRVAANGKVRRVFRFSSFFGFVIRRRSDGGAPGRSLAAAPHRARQGFVVRVVERSVSRALDRPRVHGVRRERRVREQPRRLGGPVERRRISIRRDPTCGRQSRSGAILPPTHRVGHQLGVVVAVFGALVNLHARHLHAHVHAREALPLALEAPGGCGRVVHVMTIAPVLHVFVVRHRPARAQLVIQNHLFVVSRCGITHECRHGCRRRRVRGARGRGEQTRSVVRHVGLLCLGFSDNNIALLRG